MTKTLSSTKLHQGIMGSYNLYRKIGKKTIFIIGEKAKVLGGFIIRVSYPFSEILIFPHLC